MSAKKTRGAQDVASAQTAKSAEKRRKSALTGYPVQTPVTKKTSVPRSKIRKAVLKVLSQQRAS
jgi:hypothetical protein